MEMEINLTVIKLDVFGSVNRIYKQESFNTSEIEKHLSIKRSCFKEWIKKGWIKPEIHTSTGKGNKNLFSRNDLYKICLFAELRKLGIKRNIIAEIVEQAYPALRLTKKALHIFRKKGGDAS